MFFYTTHNETTIQTLPYEVAQPLEKASSLPVNFKWTIYFSNLKLYLLFK